MTRTRSWLIAAAALCAVACSDSGGGSPDVGPGNEAGAEAGTSDGPSTPTITITSDDGKATLEIPEGALPSGVGADKVKLTALAQSDVYGSDMKGWTWHWGYRLEPDGTTLSAKAKLTVNIAPDAAGTELVLHQRTGEVETPPTDYVRDDATGDLTGYVIELSHFSTMITLTDQGDPGLATRVVVPARDHFVGETFPLAVELSPLLMGEKEIPASAVAPDEVPARRVTWDTAAWSYKRGWDASRPPLTPAFQGGFLATEAQVGQGASETSTGQFTCESEGVYSVLFRVDADLPAEITYVRQSSSQTAPAMIRQFGRVERTMLTARCVKPIADTTGDCIDSKSSNTCSYKSDAVDITGYDSRSETITQDEAKALYEKGGAYECGKDDSAKGGVKVVCPTGSAPMPAGKVYSYTMILKSPVPLADATHSLIYSLVVDSDGNVANNWKTQGAFDWDYFQGADRWFQLIWDHIKKVWLLTVTQVDAQQQTSLLTSSTVRAIIANNAITFKIAAIAFIASVVNYRLTAFGHDGKFSETDRGGDVSNTDPTKPLEPTK